MSHEAAGDEMALRRRDPPTAAHPLDDENLLGEILLRVPPLPSSLIRSSLVSKLWERLATAPAFHRRFVAHHRQPPILGVFWKKARELAFTSLLGPPDRIPPERFFLRPDAHDKEFASWILLGCRHGRVLIASKFCRVLLVFDPVSGDRCRVSIPPDFSGNVDNYSGAVLCAPGDDQGHVHGDCHSSPFKVVVVGTRRNHPAVAQVYSSQTGMWGDLVSTTQPCVGLVNRFPGKYESDTFPCTLVGNVLYWWMYESDNCILEFDLHSQRLAVIAGPSGVDIYYGKNRIIRGEDGGVGLAVFSYPSLNMWKRKFNSQGVYAWELQKTVLTHEILGLPCPNKTGKEAIVGYSEDADAVLMLSSCCSGLIRAGKDIVGYSEDAHAVFISVTRCSGYYTFIVELESMQSRKINQRFFESSYHPFTDFYTAGTVRAIEPPQQ